MGPAGLIGHGSAGSPLAADRRFGADLVPRAWPLDWRVDLSAAVSAPSQPAESLDQSRTRSAYSLQWNRFRIVRPDEDRATFRNRTGLTAADLAGATVLDAGCGMGRYLRVAAELGAARSSVST